MHPIQIIGANAAAPTPAVLPTVKPDNVNDTAPPDTENAFAAVFISIAAPEHPYPDKGSDGVTPEDAAPDRPVANETLGTDARSGDLQFHDKPVPSMAENSAEPVRHIPPFRQATAVSDPDPSARLPHLPPAMEPQGTPSGSKQADVVPQATPVAAKGVLRTFVTAGDGPSKPSLGKAHGVDPVKDLPPRHPFQGPELLQSERAKPYAAEKALTRMDLSAWPPAKGDAAGTPISDRRMHQPDVPRPPPAALGDTLKPGVERVEHPQVPPPASARIDEVVAPRTTRLTGTRTVGSDLPLQRPDLDLKQHQSPVSRKSEALDISGDTVSRQGAVDIATLWKPHKPLFVGRDIAVSPNLGSLERLDPLAVDVMPEQETGLRGSAEVSKPGVAPMPLSGHQGNPLAQHVARQLAEAMQQMPNRPVEISLNPQELGRMRLSMSSSETGILVHLLAERPETMDLMRRQISELQSAFQEIGYRDIRFSFSDGRPSGSERDDSGQGTGTTAREEVLRTAENAPEITLSTALVTGLDIRL